jgi:mRNA-degrading endonuclease RelE of RelBE toxin-antitoxin system
MYKVIVTKAVFKELEAINLEDQNMFGQRLKIWKPECLQQINLCRANTKENTEKEHETIR